MHKHLISTTTLFALIFAGLLSGCSETPCGDDYHRSNIAGYRSLFLHGSEFFLNLSPEKQTELEFLWDSFSDLTQSAILREVEFLETDNPEEFIEFIKSMRKTKDSTQTKGDNYGEEK